MKNMKISRKLIVSFLIVIVLAVLIGAIGIVGMIGITNADTELYEVQTKPLPDLAKSIEYAQRLRVQMRNCILYAGDANRLSETEATLNSTFSDFEKYMANYDVTIANSDARIAFDDVKNIYEREYKPIVLDILAGAKHGEDQATLILELDSTTAMVNRMMDNLTKCMEIKVTAASEASDANDALSRQMLVIIIAVLVVAVIIALFMALYISRLISKPVTFMKDVLLRIGTKGDIDFSDSEYKQTEDYAAVKDEVGESLSMLLATIRRLVNVGKTLEIVAGGDLTAELELLSERDTMGLSLKKMTENLNNMFGEINMSTAQVSTGSKQIADGAQALAQGSTEQAAAVEQLSSSIAEIALKTKDNAEMAGKAANLAGSIKQNAEKGSTQMDQMMEAVKEINQASQSINRVIKVIDDIAFQTNILALNAAVEAARAGQHGKGFAVVAEEVRNLAAKSAEAAKDTGSLIANSMEKAELGSRIADETAVSLSEIVSGINESTRIVGDIARSSEEQTLGIEQINKGIDQVAQVVQQNSATAEQSAAASEEMSGQANVLEELVAQFKLKVEGGRRMLSDPAAKPKTPKKISMPEKTTYAPSDDGEFGKY